MIPMFRQRPTHWTNCTPLIQHKAAFYGTLEVLEISAVNSSLNSTDFRIERLTMFQKLRTLRVPQFMLLKYLPEGGCYITPLDILLPASLETLEVSCAHDYLLMSFLEALNTKKPLRSLQRLNIYLLGAIDGENEEEEIMHECRKLYSTM
jgi:hypothetical protein